MQVQRSSWFQRSKSSSSKARAPEDIKDMAGRPGAITADVEGHKDLLETEWFHQVDAEQQADLVHK